MSEMSRRFCFRNQNSPYFAHARAVKKKRSGKRLKTDSETGVGYGRARRVRLARFARVRLLRQALPISLLILRKNPTVLQSSHAEKFACSKMTPAEQ